jgi:hypothetical protein
MSIKSRSFSKGVRTKPTTAPATLEGEQRTDSADNKQKVYLDGAERSIVTEDQDQILTTKTIDADSNTISNIDTTNLKLGVLVTDISAATSDLEIPSALAVQEALGEQNQASEIDYDPAVPADYDIVPAKVKPALDELAQRINDSEDGVVLTDGKVDDLVTLSGVAVNATDLGTFTGSTITDNVTEKVAIQELETELETKITASSTDLLTNKSIISPDRADVKQSTEADLSDYAAGINAYSTPADDGQIVFATDTKKMYQIIDAKLEAIGGGGSTSFEIAQNAHGLTVGSGIYHNGTIYVDAQANAEGTLAYHVVVEVVDVNTFIAADFGRIEVLAHGFTVGSYYFQSEATAGLPVTTQPTSGYSNPLFYVEDANTLQIKCLRPSPVGDSIALDELSDVSVPSPSDGQALIYDNGNSRWEAKDIATAATDISYDNSSSGLSATQAQAAIDEVEARVDSSEANIVTNDADIRDLEKVKNINYITNPDFESGSSDWSTSNGSIVLGLDSSSGRLRGTQSLSVTKLSVDMSGESFYTDFTVDNADLAQMLTISFDHDTSSDSAYNDGDIKIKVIQDPLGTPKTISVNGEDLRAAKGSHIAQFQTDHTIKDYRLVFEYVTAEANILAIKVDNIQVGPREVAKGAAMTDWESYTPVISNLGTGSTAINNAYQRRVGDTLEIKGTFRKDASGGTGTGVVQVTLPSGLSIDIEKMYEFVRCFSDHIRFYYGHDPDNEKSLKYHFLKKFHKGQRMQQLRRLK